MKGGVALALVGLLAVVMGVRGTYKEVWSALSGSSSASPSSSAPTASASATPSTSAPGARAAVGGPIGASIYLGGGYQGPLPNMPGFPAAQI